MGWYYAPLSRDYYPLTGKFWEWLRMTRSWLGSNNPFASSSSPSLYLVFKVPSWRGTFHSFWLPLSLQLAQAPSWSWNPKTWSFPVPAEELLFFFQVKCRVAVELRRTLRLWFLRTWNAAIDRKDWGEPWWIFDWWASSQLYHRVTCMTICIYIYVCTYILYSIIIYICTQ
jgi:hypothetical protein